MKGLSKRTANLLWALGGASLGLFGAGFSLAARAGFTGAFASWDAAATAWVAAGAAAGWLLGRTAAAFGRRVLGLDPGRSRFWAAVVAAPWLALAPGLLALPLCVRFGAGLNLDVLGWVRAPWQAAFTFLPPAGYLLLLWAGPWLLLPVFLGPAVAIGIKIKSGLAAPVPGRALFAAAFGCFLLLGAWSTSVYPPTGDEPHYLLMSQSLLADRDLDLSNNLAAGEFRRFYPARELDFHGAPSPRPGLISKHFPLLAFLILPGYALAGRFGASLLIMLAAAGLAWALYRLSLEAGAGPAAALLVWGAAVLTPPLGVYYDLIYTELPAALTFVLGAWAWLRGGRRGVFWAALAAAALPWFYPKYIPLAALLGLSLPWAPGVRRRDLVAAAAMALISGAGYVLFFRAFFGYGVQGNPFGELHPLWSRHALGNALGILVDRDFGIAPAAPGLLLGLLGAAAARRTRQAGFALAALGVQFLLYASFDDFTGSSASFSRQMIPGVLLLAAWTAAGRDRLAAAGAGGRIAGGFLLGAGALIAWLDAAWPMLRYLSPKSLIWSRLGWAPSLFPSLASHPGAAEMIWAAAAVAALGLLAWRLGSERNPTQERG